MRGSFRCAFVFRIVLLVAGNSSKYRRQCGNAGKRLNFPIFTWSSGFIILLSIGFSGSWKILGYQKHRKQKEKESLIFLKTEGEPPTCVQERLGKPKQICAKWEAHEKIKTHWSIGSFTPPPLISLLTRNPRNGELNFYSLAFSKIFWL